MKWIKISIGVVIAVVMVGFIVTSLHSVTQETVKDEIITFEILEDGYITFGVYDLLKYYIDNDYLGIDGDYTLEVNNIVVDMSPISIVVNDTIIIADNASGDPIIIYGDNTYLDDGFGVNQGDIFILTIENITQPPQLTGIIATLLLLTPLIFVGGVLAIMLNKQEF